MRKTITVILTLVDVGGTLKALIASTDVIIVDQDHVKMAVSVTI